MVGVPTQPNHAQLGVLTARREILGRRSGCTLRCLLKMSSVAPALSASSPVPCHSIPFPLPCIAHAYLHLRLSLFFFIPLAYI